MANSDGMSQVLVNGGVTVAVRKIEEDYDQEEDMKAAYMICSVRDSFNPISGAKRAISRLLSKPRVGKSNTKAEWRSAAYFESIPEAADMYPLRLGFDYIAMLVDAGCVDGCVAFAWAVAVRAVLAMRGGNLVDRETLRHTLSAVPRGVKVKPFPKKNVALIL
jgi:hypothetical protein